MIFSLIAIQLIALYTKIQLECISSGRKYHSLMMDPLACFITLFWSSVNTLRILSVSAFGERLFYWSTLSPFTPTVGVQTQPFRFFGLGWPLPCTISSKFHDAAHKYSWHSRPIFSYSSWSKNDFRLRNGGLKFTLAFRYSRTAIASTIWYRITGGILLLVYIESSTSEQSRHSLCLD